MWLHTHNGFMHYCLALIIVLKTKYPRVIMLNKMQKHTFNNNDIINNNNNNVE